MIQIWGAWSDTTTPNRGGSYERQKDEADRHGSRDGVER